LENFSPFQKIKEVVLDTLFPINCLSCGQGDSWLCEKCFSKIKIVSDQVCPYCEKAITPSGRTCFVCKKKNGVDGIIVSSSYKNDPISLLVHCYKYRFIQDIAPILGAIIIKSASGHNLPLPDLILPVPLHQRRLRFRGFNQSLLIAKYVGENITPGFEIPVLENVLVRHHYTEPQMKIKNHSHRKNNIQNAFSVIKNEEKKLKGKNIWLVDDVATTGATLFECAKVLKKAGAKEVFALVVARQEIKTKEK
jgi:ComF family protein